MNNDIELELEPDWFNPIYLDNMIDNNHRYQIYFGGSGSGKSVALAQRCVFDILNGGRNYLALRKRQNTVKKSLLNEISKVISDWDLAAYFDINKSDFVITCNINDYQIMFAGMDDPEKIKSITPKKGVLTDVWVEEATEFYLDDIKQLDKRMRGSSKVAKRLTMSFNPIEKSHWIFKNYFKGFWVDGKQFQESEELSILKTTYKDNEFLMPDDIKALENEPNKYYFEVYTLGNWGSPNYDGKVFQGFTDANIVEGLPEVDDRGYMYIFGGYDRGFTHKAGIVKIGVTYDYEIHVIEAGGYAQLQLLSPKEDDTTIVSKINDLGKLHCLFCSHEANEHIRQFKIEANDGKLDIESVRTWIKGFSKKGKDVKGNDKTKTIERLEFLNFLLTHNIIKIPHRFKDLIEEIQGLEYKKLPDGTYDRSDVLRIGDDIVDALSFACGGSRALRLEITSRIKEKRLKK